jgi:hypothetical protein
VLPLAAPLADSNGKGRSMSDSSPRFGRLIWTVLVFDSLPCLLRLFLCGQDVVDGHASRLFVNAPATFFDHYGFVLGVAICGFCGNLLILLRRKSGIPLAVAGIVIDVLAGATALFEQRHLHWLGWPDSYAFMLGAELMRCGWLILYGFVISMAAKSMRVDSRASLSTNTTSNAPGGTAISGQNNGS